MSISIRSLALALAVLLPGMAHADRAPTEAERASIESALSAAGYTSWEEIEFEDDPDAVWEVDDAIKDGEEYDLKLDADLNITDAERD